MSDPVRIFTDQPVRTERSCLIESDFWNHYLTNVRRLREGDEVEVAGPENIGEAEIVSLDPVTLAVGETRPVKRPDYDLVLAQCLTRKKKFEQSVRLGTELGVTRFIPLISERTVRNPSNPEKQQDRWTKIAVDSARISERDTLPEIEPPTEFKQGVEKLSEKENLIVGDPEGKNVDKLLKKPGDTGLVIGPEGGLIGEEKNQLRETGFKPLALQSPNLRAETASLACIVLIQAQLGQL